MLVPVPDSPPGEVGIMVADSSTQEAALVADTLRRAHLADGVPWSTWPSWSARPPGRCRCCGGR